MGRRLLAATPADPSTGPSGVRGPPSRRTRARLRPPAAAPLRNVPRAETGSALQRGTDVTATTRRSRALVLASAAALALSAVPAASAQEEGPAEDATGVACDAELLDDEDDEFPFYVVEPGQTVSCTASGLDPETDAEWFVDVYGATDDEFEFGSDEEDLDEEPYVTFGSDGPVTPTEDGELTFEFTLPEELVVGGFDGLVRQGDADDPSYEEHFGGLIFGYFLGDMTCDPDPAVRGEQVDCVAELNPGEFDWEVYELSTSDLIDLFFAVDDDVDEGDLDDVDVDLEPSASGTGVADGEGSAPFSFTLALEGDAEVFVAVASQDDAVAFYAGEIVPGDDDTTPEEPVREPVDTEDDDPAAPVAVERPTRVEAGAGGAAPGGVPAGGAAIVLGLALTAAVAVRRSVTQGR
jgi:hypothetical protein